MSLLGGITSKDMPVFSGAFRRNCCSASRPPAEAPMPTTGKPGRSPPRSLVASDDGTGAEVTRGARDGTFFGLRRCLALSTDFGFVRMRPPRALRWDLGERLESLFLIRNLERAGKPGESHVSRPRSRCHPPPQHV